MFLYRVIETRVKVWDAISSFSQTFTSVSINSIGTRKKCFLFPLLNSCLKTIEKINLLILRGDFLQSRVFFSKSAQNLATRPSRKNAAPPSWF